MSIVLNILISAVVSLASVWGFVHYVPLGVLENGSSKPHFGSTITTINGSDTLTSSRSVINTNFANLNTDKVEATVTTLSSLTAASALATVGTLTSGAIGAGFTAIAVGQGGTGSTTLSSNQILLGNGTGIVKTPAGYGSSGQFLTSNGSGAAPTWTSGSFDTTLSYNFTGTDLFKNLNASSTAANPMVLNGLSFDTPAARAASSTVLSEDGNGHLTWEQTPYFLSNQVAISSSAVAATTTVKTIVVPANTFSATKFLRVTDQFSNTSSGGSCSYEVDLGTGSATTSLGFATDNNTTLGVIQQINGTIMATTTTSESSFFTGNSVSTTYLPTVTSVVTAYSNAAQLFVGFAVKSNGSNPCGLAGESVEIL